MKPDGAKLLILAHAFDAGAHAVMQALGPCLRERTLWLRPEWLGVLRWSHRVDRHGNARTSLHGGGVGTLDCVEVGLAWNRIRWLPQPAFRTSASADRDYAGAELQALVASWLAALGERAEPPMRVQLGVLPTMHVLHWRAAAHRCGLPLADAAVAPAGFSVLRTPLGLHGGDGSGWPGWFEPACHALAQELGAAVVELGFAGRMDAPRLARVDVVPALDRPGHAHAVARWLERRIDAPAETRAVTALPAVQQEAA